MGNEPCKCCCQDTNVHYGVETDITTSMMGARDPKRATVPELLFALKEGGGPVLGAKKDHNRNFFSMLDQLLPELKIYCTGNIQTSPGVVELEGSYTEYFRTTGAIIALLACYAYTNGDDFGIDAVSKGERGPMGMDKVPGKFINIGTKPDQYKQFAEKFAEGMRTEEDWWAMIVFLAVHDVGKADEFRATVNATLPKNKRSDDHDRCLAAALRDSELKAKLLPTVAKLSPKHQLMITAGFATNFQLPQLGQGEISCINFRGLMDMPKETLKDGTLRYYLYHSIFDIAGASCNENFVYPLGLIPVYMGFSSAMEDLLEKLAEMTKPDERSLYFDFLSTNFKKAYPEFEAKFAFLAESKIFRRETGLTLLRVLALTRNTYKNPDYLLEALQTNHQNIVHEMAGMPVGPEIMLYYAPDFLRMGLGTDLEDKSGENMNRALEALGKLYRVARRALLTAEDGNYQFELNVQPAVTAIKKAGNDWGGGKELSALCDNISIKFNDLLTEGLLVLPAKN